MRKYRVEFHGFAYVEAESEEEAAKLYKCGGSAYEENTVTNAREVQDFEVFI